MVNNGTIGKGKKGRNFTNISELSNAISKGLSLQNKRMSFEESFSAAEHLINFFVWCGFNCPRACAFSPYVKNLAAGFNGILYLCPILHP